MLVVVDIDGTIDSAPREFQSLMSALQAAGHTVIVMTGSQTNPVTPQDWQEKANYLNQLGCGGCWDQLVVLPDGPGAPDIPDAKSQWLADNGADVLIDNKKATAKTSTAAGVPLVLVPWASRE